ncbi:MAG: hypothetical protein KDJ38_21170, partial [Gammaproteobacteria bacterium]|nr:hypothetical protein [Gammaproteobacteria bacterium]
MCGPQGIQGSEAGASDDGDGGCHNGNLAVGNNNQGEVTNRAGNRSIAGGVDGGQLAPIFLVVHTAAE